MNKGGTGTILRSDITERQIIIPVFLVMINYPDKLAGKFRDICIAGSAVNDNNLRVLWETVSGIQAVFYIQLIDGFQQ